MSALSRVSLSKISVCGWPFEGCHSPHPSRYFLIRVDLLLLLLPYLGCVPAQTGLASVCRLEDGKLCLTDLVLPEYALGNILCVKSKSIRLWGSFLSTSEPCPSTWSPSTEAMLLQDSHRVALFLLFSFLSRICQALVGTVFPISRKRQKLNWSSYTESLPWP